MKRGFLSFLGGLLEVEKAERKRRSEETRMKLSRLPHRKTLDDFDFTFQPGIDTRLIKELSYSSSMKLVMLNFVTGVIKTGEWVNFQPAIRAKLIRP